MWGKKLNARRADRAVKTAEAWWAFGDQLWEARFFFGPVSALALLMTAAFKEVFSSVAVYGWAGWVLVGIPTFIVASLIWFGLAWMWHFRPGHLERREAKRASAQHEVTETNADTSSQDNQELRALALTVSEAIAQLDRSVDTRLAGLSREWGDRYMKGTDEALSIVHDDIKQLRERFTSLHDRVESIDKSSTQFKQRVFDLLLAKQRLESLKHLCIRIAEGSKILATFGDSVESGEDVRRWQVGFRSWKILVSQYEDIAHAAVPESVSPLRTSAEDYRDSLWNIDHKTFNDPDLLHDFKTFCLISRQVDELHGVAMDKLRLDSSI